MTDLHNVGGAIGRVEAQSARMSRIGNTMSGAGAVAAFGLAKLGKAGIQAASDMQATKVAYETLIGSKSGADKLYKDIQKFSLLSPFNNATIAKSSIALLGTGIAADKVIPRLHAVGNAVASVGGDSTKMDGVLTVLNKMQLRAKVSEQQIRQIALRGIDPYKILQRELGLTADEVINIGKSGITGATAVEALARGFEKIGGGKAMENLNKTYAGQVGKLQDATDQMNASIGAIILPDATRFVSGLGNIASGLKDISETSPGLTRVSLGIAAGGSIALIAGGQYLKFQQMIKTTAAAKLALATATQTDIRAEVTKTGVAAREAAAIASVGTAATGTAAKMTLLSRVRMASGMAIPGMSTGAAGAAFGGGRGLTGVLGSHGAGFAGPITAGGAAMSVGLGAVAGVSARNNMQAAGYSDAQSNAYGATTGVAASAVAAFVPGGAFWIAAGLAASYGVNELYNKPMEAAAEAGTGAAGDLLAQQNEANRGVKRGEEGAREKMAAVYDQLAQQASEAGDELQALSYTTSAARQRTEAAKDKADPGRLDARRRAGASRDGAAAAAAAGQAPDAAFYARLALNQREVLASKGNRSTAFDGTISNAPRANAPRVASVSQSRDGSRKITFEATLPESQGAKIKRQTNYNTRTPAPNYAN